MSQSTSQKGLIRIAFVTTTCFASLFALSAVGGCSALLGNGTGATWSVTLKKQPTGSVSVELQTLLPLPYAGNTGQ